jgi:hypothetical protein
MSYIISSKSDTFCGADPPRCESTNLIKSANILSKYRIGQNLSVFHGVYDDPCVAHCCDSCNTDYSSGRNQCSPYCVKASKCVCVKMSHEKCKCCN